MKILKTLRFKNACSFIALLENGTTISVSMYLGDLSISLNAGKLSEFSFSLHENDTFNYEPVTVHSFNRALKVVKNRLDNTINNF